MISGSSVLRTMALLASIVSLSLFAKAQEDLTSTPSSGESRRLAERIFIETGGGPSKFMSDLFSLDSSVSSYPGHIRGLTFFAGAGYRISESFLLKGRFFRNDISGKGPWMQNSGDPREQGITATANGATRILNSGFAVLGQKTFFSGWRFHPFLEFGGGLDTAFHLSFHGNATGTDGEGNSFSVPASGKIGRREWTAILGTGVTYPIRPGVNLQSGFEWNGVGYGPTFTVNFYPLGLKEKKK